MKILDYKAAPTSQGDLFARRDLKAVLSLYSLKMTCGACPEQYDVFDSEGKQVGYLRLRHGHFRADYPDCDGDTVYCHAFDDNWKGLFDSDEERKFFLTNAVEAIHNQVQLEKE